MLQYLDVLRLPVLTSTTDGKAIDTIVRRQSTASLRRANRAAQALSIILAVSHGSTIQQLDRMPGGSTHRTSHGEFARDRFLSGLERKPSGSNDGNGRSSATRPKRTPPGGGVKR